MFSSPYYANLVEEVEEATNGAFQIDMFWQGEHPYYGIEVAEAMRQGECDMMEMPRAFMGGYFKNMEIFAQPLLIPTREIAWEAVGIIAEEIEKDQLLEFGPFVDLTHRMWPHEYWMTVDSPVTTWDALKGKRVRVNSAASAAAVELLNGTPVFMPWAEVPAAFQTGLLDGMPMSITSTLVTKNFETLKAITFMPLTNVTGGLQARKDSFDALPDDIKKTFTEILKKMEADMHEDFPNVDNAALSEAILDWGVTAYPVPTDFMAEARVAAEAVWEDWQEEGGPEAVRAIEIVKAILAKHGY